MSHTATLYVTNDAAYARREQVARHDQRIAPRVGLALDGRERGQHCGANTYHASSDSAVGSDQEPLISGVSAFATSVAGRGKRIDGAERADRDLTRRQTRYERDGDLPVEADRREDQRERGADLAGDAVLDRRPGRVRRRRGTSSTPTAGSSAPG